MVAVAFSEDFEDSEVAQVVGVPLAAVLVVTEVALVTEVATPEVASVYPRHLSIGI